MKPEVLLILILSIIVVSSVYADLTVKFLDVEQGDAILLESSGQYMLIDAGPSSANVVQYLRGIPQINYLIATHPHDDHIGGMESVINSISVQKYVDNGATHTTKTYENLMSTLVRKQIPYVEVKAGDLFTFGNTKVEVKSPNRISGDLNDDSVTLLVTDGSVRYLFTGDNEYATSPATILKVAHHGSSGSESKLNSINPEVAIIMVGSGNSYGHPSSSVVNSLKNQGIEVLRTDIDGTITIKSDGRKYTVQSKQGTPSGSGAQNSFAFTDPTKSPTVSYTQAPPIISAPSYSAPVVEVKSLVVCDCSYDKYNCKDFPLPGGVTGQKCFDYCKSKGKGDVHKLDRDKDGRVCE